MTRLEKAAYLSQIIGAIAVVVSLIYVGRQINDNTIEVRAQSVQELIVFGQEIDSWVVTNPELADILTTGSSDYEALSPAHRLRFNQYITTSLNLYEQVFYYHQSGLLEAGSWTSWDAYFRGRMQMGFGWPDRKADDTWRRVWRANEVGYSDAFRRHVNSILAN
jgi:hypothetical protein